MSILQLITRRQTRGAETFAIQLAEQLAEQEQRVIVAGLYAPTAQPPVIRPPVEGIDLSDKRSRLVPHWSILQGIARLVETEKVNIVQANASDNLKYAILSRRLFNWKAHIIYRNASLMSAWVRSDWHRRLYRLLLQEADAIASISTKSKADITETFGIAPEKVHRLTIATPIPERPNRCVARTYLEAQLGRKLSPTARLIFHIGAFTWEKNHRGLLSILARLRAKAGEEIHLVSIGDGVLKAEVEAANTLDRVHWLGYRSDVPQLLPAADLLLLPSLIEGTPGVLLEAAVHGVLPLAYRVGAVDECYPAGWADRLTVPKGDEEALAQLAAYYLQHEQERQAAAAAVNDFVRRTFALPVITGQFLDLYRQLCSASSTS